MQQRYERQLESELQRLYRNTIRLEQTCRQYQSIALSELASVQDQLEQLARQTDQARSRTPQASQGYQMRYGPDEFRRDTARTLALESDVLLLVKTLDREYGPPAQATARGLEPATLTARSVVRSPGGQARCELRVRDRYPLGSGLGPYLFDISMALDDDPSTYFMDGLELPAALASLASLGSGITDPARSWVAWLPRELGPEGQDPQQAASWLISVRWQSRQQFNRVRATTTACSGPAWLVRAYALVAEGAITSLARTETQLTLTDNALDLSPSPTGQDYLLVLSGNPLEPDPVEQMVRPTVVSGSTIQIEPGRWGEPWPDPVWVGQPYRLYRQLELDGSTVTWCGPNPQKPQGPLEADLTDGGRTVQSSELLLAWSVWHYWSDRWSDRTGPSSIWSEPVPGERDHRTQLERAQPFWQPARTSLPPELLDYLESQPGPSPDLALELGPTDQVPELAESGLQRVWNQVLAALAQSDTARFDTGMNTARQVRYQFGLSELELELRTWYPVSYWLSDLPGPMDRSMRRLQVSLSSLACSGATVHLWLVPRPGLSPVELEYDQTDYWIGPPEAAYSGGGASPTERWLTVPLMERTEWFNGTDQDRSYSFYLQYPIYTGRDLPACQLKGGPWGQFYNPNCQSYSLTDRIYSPASDFEATSSTTATLIGSMSEWITHGSVVLVDQVTINGNTYLANRNVASIGRGPYSVSLCTVYGWCARFMQSLENSQSAITLRPEYEIWPVVTYFSTMVATANIGATQYQPMFRATIARTEDGEGYVVEFGPNGTVSIDPPTGYFEVRAWQRKWQDGSLQLTTLGLATLGPEELMCSWVDWAVTLSGPNPDEDPIGPNWQFGLWRSSNGVTGWGPKISTLASVIYGTGLQFEVLFPSSHLYLDYVAQWGRYPGYRPVEVSVYGPDLTWSPENWGINYREVGPPEQVTDILTWKRDRSGPEGGYFSGKYRNWLPFQGTGSAGIIQLQFRYQPQLAALSMVTLYDGLGEGAGDVVMGPVLSNEDFQVDLVSGRVWLTESGRTKQMFAHETGVLQYNQIQATFWVEGRVRNWQSSGLANRLPVTYNCSLPWYVPDELRGPMIAPQLDPLEPGYYPVMEYRAEGRKVTFGTDLTPAGPIGPDQKVRVSYQTLALQPQLLIGLELPPGAARAPVVQQVQLDWWAE